MVGRPLTVDHGHADYLTTFSMQPKATPKTKAVRAVKRTFYDLRHAAYAGGLAPGHTDYACFVIVASARTGSTLVTRSLNQHGAAVTYGEIMRHPDLFPARFPELGNSAGLFRDDPARFLEERIYRKYPDSVAAVGFKIFYSHAPRDTVWGQAVWDYLVGQPALRVIHLRRRNLLAAQISRKKAAAADEWIKYSDASQATGVTLDYEETRARFEQARAWEREYNALFAGHPLMDLVYEDVAANYAGEMQRVQSFLSLPPRDVPPATKKRPPQPLSEQIANYDDLKARFADTPWGEFFTD